MTEINPCHRCEPPERHPKCHSSCKKHKIYVTALRVKKELIRKRKANDNAIRAYENEAYERIKK